MIDAKEFKNVIEDIIDSKINKQGITKFVSAIVNFINQDGTINVYIPPDNNNIITGLLNKTGQNLSIGDSVELCTKNGKIKNAWVAIRHGDNFVAGGGSVSEGTPIGTIVQFSGDNIPSGWLICDGSSVSRITYSSLFAKIGTIYGEGDGSTTFNLPNFSGRTLIGLDAEDPDFDSLGETGGEKTHQLTINEMPSHNHTKNSTNTLTSDYNQTLRWASGKTSTADVSTMATGNTGGDQAHNNLQPYLVVNFIIKAINVGAEEDKFIDVLPINAIVEYDGDTVPSGYEEVSEMSGSNSNGSWTKFADGTLICRKTVRRDTAITTGWGSTLYEGHLDLGDSPYEFTDNLYQMSASPGYGSGIMIEQVGVDRTKSNFGSATLVRPASTAHTDAMLDIIAIGRWK